MCSADHGAVKDTVIIFPSKQVESETPTRSPSSASRHLIPRRLSSFSLFLSVADLHNSSQSALNCAPLLLFTLPPPRPYLLLVCVRAERMCSFNSLADDAARWICSPGWQTSIAVKSECFLRIECSLRLIRHTAIIYTFDFLTKSHTHIVHS